MASSVCLLSLWHRVSRILCYITILWKIASWDKLLVNSRLLSLDLETKVLSSATPLLMGGKAKVLAVTCFVWDTSWAYLTVIARQITSTCYKEFHLLALVSGSNIIYLGETLLFKVLKSYLLLTYKTVGFHEASSYVLLINPPTLPPSFLHIVWFQPHKTDTSGF